MSDLPASPFTIAGYDPCLLPTPCNCYSICSPNCNDCFSQINTNCAAINYATICNLTGLFKTNYIATVGAYVTVNILSSFVGTIQVLGVTVAPLNSLVITVANLITIDASIILATSQATLPSAVGTSVSVPAVVNGTFVFTFTNLDPLITVTGFKIGFMIL